YYCLPLMKFISHVSFSYMLIVFLFVFFFQAEDGIRDKLVTGVQTCALPISPSSATVRECTGEAVCALSRTVAEDGAPAPRLPFEIGRASCRERVEISVVAGCL